MVCSRTCVQFEHRSHVPTSSLNRSQELPISNLSFAYIFCSCLQYPLFHSLEYHFKSLIMFYKHLMNPLKKQHHIWSQLFFSSFFTSTRTRSFNEVESPARWKPSPFPGEGRTEHVDIGSLKIPLIAKKRPHWSLGLLNKYFEK